MDEEERLTKKGLNIYLYYWTIPIFFILLIIAGTADTFNIETLDLNLMISIVSFLFGFFITITFSMLMGRVASLKDFLAVETGRLVSLFKLSKHLGVKFHEKIKRNVDNYTVNTLRDYTNYAVGRESIYEIYDDLKLMEIKTESQKNIAASFLYDLSEFEIVREHLEYLTQGRILWAMKFSNYVLAIILVVLLFLNRGTDFTNWIFVIISTLLFFILLIIEDYENLKIGDYTFNISNSEQLFDLIGVNRYYPRYLLRKVKLEKGEVYRVGIYDSEIKKERVVNMKYDPRTFWRFRG